MKNILTVAVLAFALACSSVRAASIAVIQNGTAFSLYLNGGIDNGKFDAVGVSLFPNGVGAAFTGQNNGYSIFGGTPRGPGAAFTYRNRYLDIDPTDPDTPGGLGWTIVGIVNTPTELSFGGGPLGNKITTPAFPGLFLANVNLPSGTFRATVELANAGSFIGPPLILASIPEPTTLATAGTAFFALAGLRRRRA